MAEPDISEPGPFDSIPTTDVSSFCKINERGIGSLDLYVKGMGDLIVEGEMQDVDCMCTYGGL